MAFSKNTNPALLLLSTIFKVVILFCLPFLFAYLFLVIYESIQSDNVFYSSNWGSSLVVRPRGGGTLALMLDFYFQIVVQTGTAVIFAAFCCVPFILVFFPTHGFAVTMVYSFIGTMLLWATSWPQTNIPQYLGGYASYWVVTLSMLILPIFVNGVTNMLKRELFGGGKKK